MDFTLLIYTKNREERKPKKKGRERVNFGIGTNTVSIKLVVERNGFCERTKLHPKIHYVHLCVFMELRDKKQKKREG